MSNLSDKNISAERRLLAVGGIHVFESPTPCKLERVKPQESVRNLEWPNTLALEAIGEGEAEVSCNGELIKITIVSPVRLSIKLADDRKPTNIRANESFTVQAVLHDIEGQELEVGKFTNFKWVHAGIVEPANDPSAGEFGFCDTCYGMQHFRTTGVGEGLISARLADLEGKLMIEARS